MSIPDCPFYQVWPCSAERFSGYFITLISSSTYPINIQILVLLKPHMSHALAGVQMFPSTTRISLSGPAVRVAHQLKDRASPGCLNVTPVMLKTLNATSHGMVNLKETIVFGETMLHLPGHTLAENPVKSKGTSAPSSIPHAVKLFSKTIYMLFWIL